MEEPMTQDQRKAARKALENQLAWAHADASSLLNCGRGKVRVQETPVVVPEYRAPYLKPAQEDLDALLRVLFIELEPNEFAALAKNRLHIFV